MLRDSYTEDRVCIHPGGRLVGIKPINEAAIQIRKYLPDYRYSIAGAIRAMHNVAICD